MMKRMFAPIAAFSAAAVLALSLGFSALAQDATPPDGASPEADRISEIELRPAHIHTGTCDDLGDVVYPLNDLQAAASVPEADATPPAVVAGTPDAEDVMGLVGVVAQSGTEVDVSIDDLLAEEFAINVHESPENIQNYIACGDITGDVMDGELLVELEELDNSGFIGSARLADQGDGTTIVNVSLFPVEADGTPVATPAS